MGLETTPLKLKIREIRLPDPVPTETPAATPASPGIETLTVEDMVVAAGAFWNRLADQGISGSLTATKLQQIFDEATILAARRVVPVLASILGISKSSAIQLMYAKRMEHQKLNYSMWCLCDEEAPLRLTLANLRSAIAEFEEWSVQCNASELGRAVRETPINVENIRGRLLANGAISWN